MGWSQSSLVPMDAGRVGRLSWGWVWCLGWFAEPLPRSNKDSTDEVLMAATGRGRSAGSAARLQEDDLRLVGQR
jgi:hypothetical protein